MSLSLTKQKSEVRNKNKREFSLEKIATAIHCEYLISSLRNKYSDPLIIHKKNIITKKKIKNLKNLQPNPFSFKNKLFFNLPIQQPQQQQCEEEKAIQTKNNNIINQKLPIISNKIIQQINSAKNINEYNSKKNKDKDRFLITSGMFSQRECWKNPPHKVKLGVMMNLKYDNKNENEEEIS